MERFKRVDYASKSTKSFIPQAISDHANLETGNSALGSAFYSIMEGRELYPEQDPDAIVTRFEA